MAETNAKRQNQPSSTEQQGGQPGERQGQLNQPSSDIQTTRQGQQGGLARRGSSYPSMFSLSPRDVFGASPFELMRRFTEELDRAFGDFGLTQPTGGGEIAMFTPAVEVFERDNNLIVRAELPGMDKDDVRVEVTDEGLIIQGEKRREHEERREGVYRSERSYGQFYRVIPLPEGVNADQVKAQFQNGVLEIVVPMAESQQRRHNIPIETGGQATQTAGGQAQTSTGSSSRR